MGGGGQSTNTVQSATPWSGVQPGLSALYSGAANMFGPQGTGGPQAYSGPMVTPFNAFQTSGLNAAAAQNSVGSGLNANGLNSMQQAGANIGSNLASGNTIGQQGENNILSGLGLSGTLNALGGGMTQGQQGLSNIISGQGPAMQGLNSIINGSNAGIKSLQSMLDPSYLNVSNNPALQNAMSAANYNTTFNYQNAVMPQLASQFSAAGRFGSGAQTQGINQATNNLASQISNTNAGMASNAYTNLLNNQLQAAQALPTLQGSAANEMGQMQGNASSNLTQSQLGAASAGVNAQNTAAGNMNQLNGSLMEALPGLGGMATSNAMNLAGIGGAYQSQAQNQLSASIQQYMAQQQQPLTNLNSYAQILAGGNPFATTSSSGQQTSQANPFTTAMGGLLGAGALSMTPLGAGIGAGLGGLLGGGAALGSMAFSMPTAAAGASLMPSLLGGMGMLAM